MPSLRSLWIFKFASTDGVIEMYLSFAHAFSLSLCANDLNAWKSNGLYRIREAMRITRTGDHLFALRFEQSAPRLLFTPIALTSHFRIRWTS